MRGGDKLLEPVDGVPLLREMCRRGLAADLEVRVALPDLSGPRTAATAGLPVSRIAVADRDEGMAASLRAGLSGLRAPSVLVLPADMPEITTADLHAIATHPGAIVQATTADGVPGHPVRFDARYLDALRALSGDVGARDVLAAHADEVVRVALPGDRARIDLDTPEDWAAWRATQRHGTGGD